MELFLRIRRATVWFTLACFLASHTAALAQAHQEGTAAGQEAITSTRPLVSAVQASEVVPLYTPTPPEAQYFGQRNLPAQSNARLAECQLTPQDPICQALLGARASANTPREMVSAHDPAVLGASRIASNPASALEDIASYYSGCQVEPAPAPVTEIRSCRVYAGAATYACARNLQVTVTRQSSCTPGEWFAHTESGSTGLDAQCVPDRPATQQHLRVTDAGVALAYVDVDMTATRVFPQKIATIPDLERRAVWVADTRCTGDTCDVTALLAAEERKTCTGSLGDAGDLSCTTVLPFLSILSDCPTGTQQGNTIVNLTGNRDDGFTTTALDSQVCWSSSPTPTPYYGRDTVGSSGYGFWIPDGQRAIVGWQVNPAFGAIAQMRLRYERPHTAVATSDQWEEQCPTLATGARCQVTGSPRCMDGQTTRLVDGAEVTRACWRYETSMLCPQDTNTDSCPELKAAGCRLVGSACLQTNAEDGSCAVTQNKYACPLAPSKTVSVANCPANVFCIAGNCFDTQSTKDGDFARSMSLLEAAREAAVYLDTDTMQVFKGEANSCRDRLFKNCCDSDSSGTGMTNRGTFGVGSRLVFDILMNANNRAFVTQGLSALLANGGFSGSFTSYGVTVAVNGTALPAGSSVLLSTQSMVIAFDPWSLAISVVMYAVMSLASCNPSEARLAMKEGAQLCHTLGSYCSSCLRILGRCVSCIEHTTGKCCFNSVLARIVNEQGRSQIGRGWGSPAGPDCSGFTLAQLEVLDFSKMDLSEFYASIVPTLPTHESIVNRATQRATDCYYGKGKCQ